MKSLKYVYIKVKKEKSRWREITKKIAVTHLYLDTQLFVITYGTLRVTDCAIRAAHVWNIFPQRTELRNAFKQIVRGIRFSASPIIPKCPRQISAIGKRLEPFMQRRGDKLIIRNSAGEKIRERYNVRTDTRGARTNVRCGQPLPPIIIRNPVVGKKKNLRAPYGNAKYGRPLPTIRPRPIIPQSTTVSNGRVMEIHVNPSRVHAYGPHEEKPKPSLNLYRDIHEELY